MSLSLPSQVSSKAAVAALRSLQAKLNETERDRRHELERYQTDVRQQRTELDDVQRQLQLQKDKNAELIRDFDKASSEADNLRSALLESQETIRLLREQVADGAQQTQRLSSELAGLRSPHKPTPADAAFTLDDVEQVCAKAIASAHRFQDGAKASSPETPRAMTLREIEQACDRAIRRAQSGPDLKTQAEADHLLRSVMTTSAVDPSIQHLIDRCDKLERLLLLYAKFMLKARFQKRRLKAAPKTAWSPGVFRTPNDRVADLDRAVRRMTSQCSALIDQIDSTLTVDGHERILNVLAQLDRTQAQFASIRR